MAIQQVIAELNRIRSEGLIADYAIGGAVASGAYIEVASTVDVDVFVVVDGATHPLNPFGQVYDNLVKHGAKFDGEHLVIGDWPVQLLPPGSPLYEDAIREAVERDFGGVAGRLMRPEHLAAIALATGRVKDYPRVAEYLKTGIVDRQVLEGLVARHGLGERWNTYLTRFPLNDA